jgi:subtilisin family serine protease
VRDLNGNGRVDAGDLLADRRWADGKDGDGNRYKDDLFGWDFANNDNDPFDDNGHGTHVSGTLGGVGGNGAGVAGVAWAVEVFALKFLDAGSAGTVFNAIKAIDYFTGLSKASANAGLDFVATNNSWTGGGFSQGLLDAIDRGAGAGLLFVAAAGNGGADGVGDDNDAVASYPSGYDTSYNGGIDAVVSVAAIDGAGALAGFSNRGELSVDLGAPGVSVWSTLPGGGYGPKNGTSMAAPHVTGALALHAASHPSASAAELRAALLGSAEPTPSLAGLTATGGRLDVGDLLLLG